MNISASCADVGSEPLQRVRVSIAAHSTKQKGCPHLRMVLQGVRSWVTLVGVHTINVTVHTNHWETVDPIVASVPCPANLALRTVASKMRGYNLAHEHLRECVRAAQPSRS